MWRLRTRYASPAPLPERLAPGSNDAEVRLGLLHFDIAVVSKSALGQSLLKFKTLLDMN